MIKYITLAAILILAFNTLYAQKPTFVRPANVGDVPVQYITISFHTANLKDANTDDAITVALYPGMKPFNLNTSNDNFERNQTDQFIITDPKIVKIKDIKQLLIIKSGSNGWAFDLVTIAVNGCLLYKSTLNPRWLDNTKGFKLSHTFAERELSNGFAANYKLVPDIFIVYPLIPKKLIKLMIESVVGNCLGNSPEYTWGNKTGINTLFGDATELVVRNTQTLSIDLDLQIRINYDANIESDEDFDIVISCNQGKVAVDLVYTNGGCPLLTNGKLKNAIAQLLSRNFNSPTCLAHFESNGDLKYY